MPDTLDTGKIDEAPAAPAGHTCLRALVVVARFHGHDLTVERLVQDNALDGEPAPRRLADIAGEAGLDAKAMTVTIETLEKKLVDVMPLVAVLQNGNGVVIVDCTPEGDLMVLDPLVDRASPFAVSRDAFLRNWMGAVVLVRRGRDRSDGERRFGLSWFLREIGRHKRDMAYVVVAVLTVNLLALAVPLFFQIVIDRVLVHGSMSTLTVLTVGIIGVLVFQAILGFLRSFILLHATRRIDMRLLRRTYSHMLSLPSQFFSRVRAGVLTKHMQQASNIREFLTGQAMMTLLDLSMFFVFLPVLIAYSMVLTAIVLGFTLLMAITIGLMIIPYRRRLQALYNAEGRRQSMLVESIHGIQTVKALALEPRQRIDWDEMAATAVNRTYDVGMISISARAISGLLEQLLTVAIIAVGVHLVFAEELSVGSLIAFQMLSGRVTGPLVQLVGLIHQYQETSLSVRMLGEVMNSPAEANSDRRALHPRIEGQIEFKDVEFAYPGVRNPTLQNIDFTVEKGSFVGIVGPSGSGKTTITRLVQALYWIDSGAILVDGTDIRDIDLAHLRNNIGVVLQESFLFSGTIRDNIRMGRADATFEDVIAAAKLAGADDFVSQLPHRYDTELEEGARNLSGGERQRLAIARALIRNPKILIFDEATSALDPESEYLIRKNLSKMARGRTLIAISHRLSMVRDADMLLVVENGRVTATGPHDVLLKKSPTYKRLWEQQMGSAK